MGFNSGLKGLILNFLDTFSEHTQISNFMKILPVRAELSHEDGRTGKLSDRRTDVIKLILRFVRPCILV